jgi:hypothetical protein
VRCGIVDAFIERREVPTAFSDVVSIGTPPDPALVVALKKIPRHVVPPLNRIVPRMTAPRALKAVVRCLLGRACVRAALFEVSIRFQR